LIQWRKEVYEVKLDTELHVITPNEPGILGRVLGTLANAGVNLRALNAFSEGKKGVFLMVTTDNVKAQKHLEILGYKIKSNPVVTVLLEDRIGAGSEIGALLGNAVIDVDYCYGSSAGIGKVLLVFKTSNNKKAVETLR
jgi:hypothetical protein